MPPTPKAPSRTAPATVEWDPKKLTTIRPGAGLGPLLQRRTMPRVSPGQVSRRDLARYYIILGADRTLNAHARALLHKAAALPIALPADAAPSALLALISAADAGEQARAASFVPSVSPFLTTPAPGAEP